MSVSFNKATVGVNVRCRACSGSGNYRIDMNIIALEELVSPYFPDRKIDAIKELRGIYEGGDIGLKTAKLLVELVFDFQQNLADIVKENNATDRGGR